MIIQILSLSLYQIIKTTTIKKVRHTEKTAKYYEHINS
nr:MAG TPA: hypothetical protein [Caudoviricetes sp.]